MTRRRSSLRPNHTARWAALLCLVLSTPLTAQRTVRESTAEWRAATPLRLVEERRWCADSAAAGCEFREIVGAITLADGGVVATGVMGPIHQFAADGRFERTLGRKGRGPGEYGFVVGLNQTPDGRLTWFDNTQMRIASIALDGTPGPVRAVTPPQSMAMMWMRGVDLVVLDIPAAASLGDTVTASYLVPAASGTPRVLARVRAGAIFLPNTNMLAPMGTFAPRIVSDVGPAGDIVHGFGSRYALEVFPAVGDPWRLIVDAPVRKVTAAEHDSATAVVLKSFRAASVASLPPTVRAALENRRSEFPPLVATKVVRDGTIWIRPVTAPGAARARWDLFSRDGRRVGRVELPLSSLVLDGTLAWVLVSELGGDDTPQVVRYRLGR